MYDDEFAGQGGSYLVDPLTGKRSRMSEDVAEIIPDQNPIKPRAKSAGGYEADPSATDTNI